MWPSGIFPYPHTVVPVPLHSVFGTLFFHVFGVGKTTKKVSPKRGPRWLHKASRRSQDAIWGPFWGTRWGPKRSPKWSKKNDLAETLIFETSPTRNQGFCPPRPTENGTKKRLKNDLATRALKIRRFSALGGSKTGTRGPKASQRVPRGTPKWNQNGVQEGLQIWLVSKFVP